MFPEDPSSQYNKGVETFLILLPDFPPGLSPPLRKGVRMSSRYQTWQVQGIQNAEPELPGKHTRSEYVLGCLIFLVAEGAVVWGWSPLRKWSAVQQRLWMTSQTKILHLLGVQAFHKRFHDSKWIAPIKKALWGDLVEKIPELSNFHWCRSVKLRWISEIASQIFSVRSTMQKAKLNKTEL